MNVSKKEMQAMAKAIRKNIKAGKGRPKTVKVTDTKGKAHKLTRKQYLGLFKQWNLFFQLNHINIGVLNGKIKVFA